MYFLIRRLEISCKDIKKIITFVKKYKNIIEDFKNIIKEILPNEWEAFFEALKEDIPTSIRINDKVKLSPSDNIVKHCPTGYYLDSRPIFTLDPRFHAGAYYVQEAGSMYLEKIISPYIENNQIVLDLCAAPGGKSTHLANLITKDSLLICNEALPARANILHENMCKWGRSEVLVCNNSAKDFGKLGAFTDIIVADLPCSGEGMFRKDEQAVKDWSLEAVEHCATRQREIVSDVWDALKENGIFIYSTCTFNRKENEENVQWVCENLGAELIESRHFYFHTDMSEGFFIASMRKTSSAPNFKHIKSKPSKYSPHQELLINPENWAIIEKGNEIYSIPRAFEAEISYLCSKLRVLKIGVKLGEKIENKKKIQFIPDTQLALCKDINTNSWASVELDRLTALKFLKCESITLADAPIGYVLVKYDGVNLGWVKNIGNRCNNLYPDLWRIRMNIPEELCALPF